MSVGSRIKELRESKDMSRNELADSVGVTIGAISNYENEVSSPKEPILFKIMEVLKCDANYLFQDAIEMPKMKNTVSVEEFRFVEKYRELDAHGREMVDFTLTKEWERSIDIKNRPNNIAEMHPHLMANAAHKRTDIEVTDEMKQHDDNLMSNDKNWE